MVEFTPHMAYTVNTNIEKFYAWGCTGFDIVIGRSGLRVRELFSVINGQIKINAENNVIYADFGAKRALAA